MACLPLLDGKLEVEIRQVVRAASVEVEPKEVMPNMVVEAAVELPLVMLWKVDQAYLEQVGVALVEVMVDHNMAVLVGHGIQRA